MWFFSLFKILSLLLGDVGSMAKNYYIVLRVSRAESPRGIQDAFRELAKKYHPDRIGPQGTRTFEEILEAYQALSDPEKRKLHNQELYKAETQEEIRPEPIRVRRPRVEPLVLEPMSILRDFQTIRPGYEPLFDRIFRNFTGVGIPKGELPEGLNLELMVSSDEAVTGITAPIRIPIFYPCPACGGSGRNWLFPCVECGEQGMIEDEKTIHVRIPSMVRDGTVMEIPIRGLGIHNFYLRLHILIAR